MIRKEKELMEREMILKPLKHAIKIAHRQQNAKHFTNCTV